MDPYDLYGLPLERFVPERTALAKALRASGERDEAAGAAKLAKPSIPAWAVNQLVRTQAAAIDELFAAGDALKRAQEAVVAGRGSAAALREAAERERQAVATLTEAARGLLSSEGDGLSRAALERVSQTLHAAALDERARAEVNSGCLTRELRHVGLGEGASAGAPTTRPRARQSPRQPGAVARRREQEQAARERTERLAAARRDEKAARRAAERGARELEAAEQRRDRAAESLRDAEQALREAGDQAEAAERARRGAQQALDQIRSPRHR